ncbi:hypothetical protein [Paracoccus sp. pheM1]|uniref:hypothetical protein n=1 Tax=Paracoccus sp. pheM1 TaxID=2831675 RepID=UPI001BDB8744|nr:hypothetical protein [Paracoccus sp. pheM1]MBT0780840.1 hypothetical protein [Paracoccus sp. pheM1]
MFNREHWDPTPPRLEKQPPLEIHPIHGVLPFAGSRNPLTRSNTARRVSMTFSTPHLNGAQQVFLFESELESAVALEVMLSPDFYHLEVQLPPIFYNTHLEKPPRHHFDLRVTFRDGHRRLFFVRNAESLRHQNTTDEIAAIYAAIPAHLGDSFVVASGEHYSRARRDNLRKIWDLSQDIDPDADLYVLEAARTRPYSLAKELVSACHDLPRSVAMHSIYRLIGQNLLTANWDATINKYSRVWPTK